MPSPSQSIRVRSPSEDIMIPQRRVSVGYPRGKKIFALGLVFALVMTFLYLFTQVFPLIPIPMVIPNDYFVFGLFILGVIGIILMLFSKVRVKRDPHKLQFKKELSKEEMRQWKQRRREG